MKIKPNLESCVYAAVIILCLITMLLVLSSGDQFTDTKIVYQAF
jgi:hypothetical protein